MSYADYLRSAHWQRTRAVILRRARGRCERKGCGAAAVQVHHKTYKRLGFELPEDLEALCFLHHQKEHPDKIGLPDKSFLAEIQCRMCSSVSVEVFVGDDAVCYICTGCGEPWRQDRRKPKKHRQRRPRPPRTTKAPAPEIVDRGADMKRLREKIEGPHRGRSFDRLAAEAKKRVQREQEKP